MLFFSFSPPFLPYVSILPAQLISPLTAGEVEERERKEDEFWCHITEKKKAANWRLETWTLGTSGQYTATRQHCT